MKNMDKYERSFLRKLLEKMMMIREFEMMVNEYFMRGVIPGTIHLSHYQEAVPVGIVSALGESDVLFPTHRSHGHALAKGMDPYRLFCELFAKANGCCAGKGGSIHLCEVDIGLMPSNPIVGSAIPVAAGVALEAKMHKKDTIAAVMFGDGAINTGPFHEGVNLAAVLNLNVLLVCENNQYAISTRAKDSSRLEKLSDRAKGYGIPGITVDGNDVLCVYEAAKDCVNMLRAGKGPVMLECVTYRVGGHKRDDAATYRPKEEVEYWIKKDPIVQFKKALSESGILTKTQMEHMQKNIASRLRKQAQDALDSPDADEGVVFSNVYA